MSSERDILALALEVATRSGDPAPTLIQHTTGTREATTKTTGSWVRSDAPSYLIAMRGQFMRQRPRPPHVGSNDTETELEPYPVHVLIVDISSGQVTDIGSGFDYPDLAAVGPVVTDWRGRA